MTAIKMWVKINLTFFPRKIQILKMEGMGHLLVPKSVLLMLSTNMFIRVLSMLREIFKRK